MKWHRPDLNEERGEFIRQARDLNINCEELMSAAKLSILIILNDSVWNAMKNTDSNADYLSWHEVNQWGCKDVKGIMSALLNRKSLPTPIVLIYENIPYRVAGNTRLSICKLLQIRPKILLICFDRYRNKLV